MTLRSTLLPATWREAMTESDQQLALMSGMREVQSRARRSARGYEIRRTESSDGAALAALYLAAYSSDALTAKDADEELVRTFAGEYGYLDFDASPKVLHRDEVVAAVMVVHAAPWPNTPPGPFVIEVMVDPRHRRQGLAEWAMGWSADRLASSGADTMALFVMSGNAPARALYDKLGFTTWVAG